MSEKKKMVPQLRFPGFSGEWEERKLGELGSVAMNKRIYKDQTTETGDVPFYKIGTFGSEPDAFISRKLFEEYKEKYQYPDVGDILISASGSIGRTVEYKGEDEYFQDSNIVWLDHGDQLDNSFLKQFYSIVKWRGLEGSTIKRLYNKNILDTEIIVPELEEQEKIGAFFKQLDHLITLHQRKLTHLQARKKGLLQKMFPKDGELFPELRYPGFTDAWEQRQLSEVAEQTFGGGTPKTSVDEYWSGEIPWIQSSDLTDGKVYGVVPNKTISEAGLNNSATKLIPANSIALITRVGVGKLAFMPFSYATSQDFLSLSSLKIDPWFCVYSCYKKLQSELHVVQGTSIKGITKDELLAKKIPVPVKEEQAKIGAFFKQLDDSITLHQRKLDHLQTRKKALLQQLFV